jgi:DNA-binding NarL/FixJ family response regulator
MDEGLPMPVPEVRRGPRKVVIRFADTLLRDALASWVDSLPGYRLAGAVENGPALVQLCAAQSPDVAVVQIGSAATDELNLLAGLRGVRPVPHVVGLHHALDPRSLLRLHRAGAHQLVSSRFGLAALRAALGEVAAEDGERPVTSRLTGRELEILMLISAGCSAAEVAKALQISPYTVTNHMRRVFAKLDVHSRSQAAAEMARLGLPHSNNGHRPDPVAGRAGPLRDQVSHIVARNRLGNGPEVSVLVNPTDSAWLAGARSEKVVVLSEEHASRSEVAAALSRGARAVLTEEELAARLPAAISLVRAGYLVADNDVVRGLIVGALSASPPPTLTPREKDILESVALGHSVRQTAQSLGIAIKTVQSEQRQLFSKLGARNRLHALAQARELRLVDR